MNNSYTPVQMVKAMREQRADTELRIAKWLRAMQPFVSQSVTDALEVLAEKIESGEYRDDG